MRDVRDDDNVTLYHPEMDEKISEMVEELEETLENSDIFYSADSIVDEILGKLQELGIYLETDNYDD
jgi:hypothetical protein